MNNGRVGGDIVSGGSVTVHTAQPDHPSMWDDSNPILLYNVQYIQWQPHPNEDLDRWGILTTITVIFAFSKNHWHPKVMICFQVQHKNGCG